MGLDDKTRQETARQKGIVVAEAQRLQGRPDIEIRLVFRQGLRNQVARMFCVRQREAQPDIRVLHHPEDEFVPVLGVDLRVQQALHLGACELAALVPNDLTVQQGVDGAGQPVRIE